MTPPLEALGLALALAASAVAAYAALIASLALLGRAHSTRAVARFVPDCAVLLARLLRDPHLERVRRLALVAPVGYLALPIDLVPDFLPVLGHLDDALVVWLALRWALRGQRDRIAANWPGPPESLALVLKAAGVTGPGARVT